jgi:hypothetical protein
MTATLEREIKLPFENAEAARAAVLASTRPTTISAAADPRCASGRTAAVAS